MRLLPTRIHGVLDYGMGALLVVAPWLFGFADAPDDAATWVPVVLGLGVIVYSLLTDYELGVARKIPMPTHLLLDLGGGVLLAASPWLFGFAEWVWVPHLVFGLLEGSAALMTQKHPASERTASRRPGLA